MPTAEQRPALPARSRLGHLFALFDRLVLPAIVFALVYAALFMLLRFAGLSLNQWVGLLAAVGATIGSIAVLEKRRFDIGLGGGVAPSILRLAGGLLVGGTCIVAADAILAATGSLQRTQGSGLPWYAIVTVFMPAAVHEELLFRGYLYQKLRLYGRMVAIGVSSVIFAAMHAGNTGVDWLPFLNLLLGGVLLAAAYESRRSLWLAIGVHFAWNFVSGPVLGYAVSGYVSNQSIWSTRVGGPEIINGGAFGLEGSIAITLVEVAAIAMFALLNRRRA